MWSIWGVGGLLGVLQLIHRTAGLKSADPLFSLSDGVSGERVCSFPCVWLPCTNFLVLGLLLSFGCGRTAPILVTWLQVHPMLSN